MANSRENPAPPEERLALGWRRWFAGWLGKPATVSWRRWFAAWLVLVAGTALCFVALMFGWLPTGLILVMCEEYSCDKSSFGYWFFVLSFIPGLILVWFVSRSALRAHEMVLGEANWRAVVRPAAAVVALIGLWFAVLGLIALFGDRSG